MRRIKSGNGQFEKYREGGGQTWNESREVTKMSQGLKNKIIINNASNNEDM